MEDREELGLSPYAWDITTFNQLLQLAHTSKRPTIKTIIKHANRPGDGAMHAFANLEGIEEFTRLEILNLNFECTVKDISSLSSLKNLKEVYLCGVETGLSALDHSVNLEVLRLNTHFVNLHTLPAFPLLKHLDLTDSHIEDLSGIERFTTITTLSLCNIQPASLEPISQLTQLTTLKLTHNHHITQLSFISPLVNLLSLDLSVNYNIEEISSLKSLVKLEKLDFYSSKKITQESLADLCTVLTKLKHLHLWDMNIHSLEFLSPLRSSLEDVLFYDNPVRDFSVLVSFPNLKSVVVDYKIKDEVRALLPDISVNYNR